MSTTTETVLTAALTAIALVSGVASLQVGVSQSVGSALLPPTPESPSLSASVNITHPKADTRLTPGEPVAINVSTTDDSSVTNVTILVDGETIATRDSTPATVQWEPTTGSHTIRARIETGSGTTDEDSITVQGDVSCEGCVYEDSCISEGSRHPDEPLVCVGGSFRQLPSGPGTVCDGCQYNNTCISEGSDHPDKDKVCQNGSFVSKPDCDGCLFEGTCYEDGSKHPDQSRLCINGTFKSPPGPPEMGNETCTGCVLGNSCIAQGESHPSTDRVCKNGSFVTPSCDGCLFQGTCYTNGSSHPDQDKVCIQGRFVERNQCDGCKYNGTCYNNSDSHPDQAKFCHGTAWIPVPGSPTAPNGTSQPPQSNVTPPQNFVQSPQNGSTYPAHSIPVTIANKVANATVFVDGDEHVRLIKPPLATHLQLEPGQHVITIRAAGQDVKREINARNPVQVPEEVPGRQVALEKKKGRFTMRVNGNFHSYSKNGKFSLSDLPAGTHRVTVEGTINGTEFQDQKEVTLSGPEQPLVKEEKEIPMRGKREQVPVNGSVREVVAEYNESGKSAKISVSEESDVDTDVEGSVYRFLNISLSDAVNATVSFRIPKQWLEENGLDETEPRLYHGGDAWEGLTTWMTGEDSDYIYYNATVDRFSPFIIGVIHASTADGQDTTDSSEEEQQQSTGGGGAPPPAVGSEDADEKAIQSLYGLQAGESVVYSIGRGTRVREITLTPTSRLTRGMLVVDRFESKPELKSFPGTAYTIWDIISDATVSEATITFSLDSSWLQQHGYTPDQVNAYHYDGTWKRIRTEHIGSDATGPLFRAQTSSLSYFTVGVTDTDTTGSAAADRDTEQDDRDQDSTQTDSSSQDSTDRSDSSSDQQSEQEQQQSGQSDEAEEQEESPDTTDSRPWWHITAPLIFVGSVAGIIYLRWTDLVGLVGSGPLDDKQLAGIREYIRRNQSYGREKLREKLVKAGWPEDVVENELDKYF